MEASDGVVVVGGGAFGATAALELRRRGRSVTLLDAGPLPHPDASSTDISKLVRMDYGADAFYTDLAARALAGWRAWNSEAGRTLYHADGLLVLSSEPLGFGGFEGDSHDLLVRRGIPLQRLRGAEAIAARAPAWSAGTFRDGYFNPDAGWAESGRAMAFVLERCSEAGVELLECTPCAGLVEAGGRVVGVRLEGGAALPAGEVVVAAGAWTPTLLPELGEVLWAVGQPVLHFRPPAPAPWRADRFPPWAADIQRTGFYGFPLHPSGVVKVGHHGAGWRVDPRAPRALPAGTEDRFRAFLRRALPALAEAPLAGARVCLYCDSFDGDFWIARDPARPGLTVAAGGSGHGFKFAPVLGPIVADVVEGHENPAAARFRWRPPGPRRTEQARAEPS